MFIEGVIPGSIPSDGATIQLASFGVGEGWT